MNAEEKSRKVSKNLYKLELLLLKFLPALIAVIYFINTLLSLFEIDLPILSYMVGMSLLPIIFMYLSSYVFQFCEYHRLPLHYIVVNIILCSIEYYIGIPVSIKGLIALHCCVFAICLFVILYLYLKSRRNERFDNKPIGKTT